MSTAQTQSKPRLSLLDYGALVGLVRALEAGETIHAGRRAPPTPTERLESAGRHILKALSGEDVDEESGLPHVDAAMAQLHLASATGAPRAVRPVDPWALPDGWSWSVSATAHPGAKWSAVRIDGVRICADTPIRDDVGALLRDVRRIVRARNGSPKDTPPPKAKATRPEGAGEPGSAECDCGLQKAPPSTHSHACPVYPDNRLAEAAE